MKAIYADFKDKGFDVLGISLDTDKAKWQKAIEEEGYEWVQVSDLLGFKSPIYKQYDINGIPLFSCWMVMAKSSPPVCGATTCGRKWRNTANETID